MSDDEISARGERAAIGGYLPQFDAFAKFAYNELVNKNLEWIKVADPNAEKLDDIQYGTLTELHAYQVKWTIADDKISFLNFKQLLPLITGSWKKIKEQSTSKQKKVIPHLLTNKFLSNDDSIEVSGKKIGTCKDFFQTIWINLKIGQNTDVKWNLVINDLKKISNLSDSEFDEFVRNFDFQAEYKPREVSIINTAHSKRDDDLIKFRNFILEKVADPQRIVKFEAIEIIKALNWENRFKTTFNHDLVVDRQTYQPIQSTLDLLNSQVEKSNRGYIFLQGGPGTGKSTLLTQWSGTKKERIIKYYAFDFKNPSSRYNYSDRGDSTTLFFDLVYQLKEAGIYTKDILPYQDLRFLKDVFFEQLNFIGKEFESDQRKTILIIDGLDHIPREYKSAKQSFIRELPLPNEIPNGVYIILGSQSYDLEDLPTEIRTEYKAGNQTIQIDPLSKNEVFKYIEASNIISPLSSESKLTVYEKSQGHPLYLSYLVERITNVENAEEIIESFIPIEGEIENYYNKIWEPIQTNTKLIELIGLIARINEAINLDFVIEWGFEQSVLKDFKINARFLFNESLHNLTFFHNSFRQFLLNKTSINHLTDEFDTQIDKGYHKQLAAFYKLSQAEPYWNENYHLFKSEQYDAFLSEATPERFTSQLINFRPAEEIRQDAVLGMEIAKQRKDVQLLTRYLFAIVEIERRLSSVDPASFTEELLDLKKEKIAKNYLRTENGLNCSEEYALKASRLFIEAGDNTEGAILFNMAYPDYILDTGIELNDSHRYEVVQDALKEWISVAFQFIGLEDIIAKVNNINFVNVSKYAHFPENESDLRLKLLSELSYSLIQLRKWDYLQLVLKELKVANTKEESAIFRILALAIEQCLVSGDHNRAEEYLSILLTLFKKEITKPIRKIYISDLIYQVTNKVELFFPWINDLSQPSNVGKKEVFGYNDFLAFMPLIKLNKLLNICGKGVPITEAIPEVKSGTDEEILVQFERMICLVTQFLSEGILNQTSSFDIRRVHPVVNFYYKDFLHRNQYWYRLTEVKEDYFDFLIHAISKLGNRSLERLSEYLFHEFSDNPKYWPSSVQRGIIKSLFQRGYGSEKSKVALAKLESFMLLDKDISGRVSECIAQSRVWMLLGEHGNSEKWIKQSIQESIGVGYRKDYQFSNWINWLKKINSKEPENAPDRIKWFLSNLNHIKATTEGSAYWDASDKLLQTTFDWNFSAGFSQLQWQLREGLIDFEGSLSIFLESYLERVENESDYNEAFQLYLEIPLFISTNPTTYLLNQVLEKGFSLLGTAFFENHLPRLINCVNTKSLETNRFDLLTAIEKFCKSRHISLKDYYPNFKLPEKSERDRSQSSSNTLTLKNRQTLSEEAVLEKVEDFESFKEFVSQQDQANSYFTWDKVIDKISPELSIDNLKEIYSLELGGRRDSQFYAKLSASALNLGDQEFAMTLANKSLELSSESGWVKFYDGGTRIAAFEALWKINPEFASSKAFEVFTHDIANRNYGGAYAEHLDDILPLLTENFRVELIWSEVFDYLKRLMSNSTPIENLPQIVSSDKPINEILIEYLLVLSKNPVRIINERAMQLLATSIENGNIYAINLLMSFSPDNQVELDILNNVMMYLFGMKSEKLIKLKEKASELAISKNYSIRENARTVLLSLNEALPVPKRINLPEIYTLHLQKTSKLKVEKEADVDYPSIDVNDPEDIAKPYGYIIDILSRESGLQKNNLFYRFSTLMNEIGSDKEWTTEYERNLRTYLEEISLKYPFPRPRVLAAKKAAMCLAGELIDAGMVDEKRIEKLTITHDYSVPFSTEVPKPSFIQKLNETKYGSVGNDWINRIKECPRLQEGLIPYLDNTTVIGECSMLRSLDWGSPSESFMSQLAIGDEIDQSRDSIFHSTFETLSSDYHNLKPTGPYILIIMDHRFDQFGLKSRWLAFNPSLARYLKWQPETNKLFAWKDKQDNLMVESIYWLNGNTSMSSHTDGETGEGWFVVASEKALKQITDLENNLFVQKSVTRERYEEKKHISKSVYGVTSYLNAKPY